MHDSLQLIDQPADRLLEAPVAADSRDLAMKIGVELGDDPPSVLLAGAAPQHAVRGPFEDLPIDFREPADGKLGGERLEGESHRENLIDVGDAQVRHDVAAPPARPYEPKGRQPLQSLARWGAAYRV